MQKQMVKLMQTYKVLDLQKWAELAYAVNPQTFADFNRLITAGVVVGCIARA